MIARCWTLWDLARQYSAHGASNNASGYPMFVGSTLIDAADHTPNNTSVTLAQNNGFVRKYNATPISNTEITACDHATAITVGSDISSLTLAEYAISI